MKEQVGEKRCTVSTHRYADCLLKNIPTKHKNYVVNQKLEHLDGLKELAPLCFIKKERSTQIKKIPCCRERQILLQEKLP
jgi:hypothetical protein